VSTAEDPPTAASLTTAAAAEPPRPAPGAAPPSADGVTPEDSPSSPDELRSDADVIAAVDLGSNSFHMVVARVSHGGLVIVDRLREMVRLGAGLDEDGNLSQEAMDRAVACLGRFSERLRAMQAGDVRVVGTNTLRKARNRGEFLDRVSDVLGHSIDIVSGVEEARLVYLGAAHSLPTIEGSRLVVDIGGGSTELITGAGLEPLRLESLYVGCVSVSRRFFPDGKVSKKAFKAARLSARQELEPVAGRFRAAGWDEAAGTSGTIRATARILAALEDTGGRITRRGLRRLGRRLVREGVEPLCSHGLSAQRAPVFPGGVAILSEVFEALGIETMIVADGALREGLLYDQLGRLTHEDARERSVRMLAARFHADSEQAARVRATAEQLFGQVAKAWDLHRAPAEQLLRWAAELHEIGLDIAHAGHHRHAAYLLAHADLAGFSTGAQAVLAAMVGHHRRKFKGDLAEGVPTDWVERTLRLTVLLRLAVLLHRSRQPDPLPEIEAQADAERLSLKFPSGWLTRHPLTRADLQQERDYLATVGIRLDFS
jgi:exopolyphosphatase/guanosine-5'-triphosphate,3'-diphosphate pyrophosphatase